MSAETFEIVGPLALGVFLILLIFSAGFMFYYCAGIWGNIPECQAQLEKEKRERWREWIDEEEHDAADWWKN